MLYYPLQDAQKYGIKYIVDMVVYRSSKGLISLFLLRFKILGFSRVFWSFVSSCGVSLFLRFFPATLSFKIKRSKLIVDGSFF